MPLTSPDQLDKDTGALTSEQRERALRRSHRYFNTDDDPRQPATEYPFWFIKWKRPVLLMEGVGLVSVVADPVLADRTVEVEVISTKERKIASWYVLHTPDVGEAMRGTAKRKALATPEEKPAPKVKKRRRKW